MKFLFVFLIMCITSVALKAQPTFDLSKNVYRIPYATGETIGVGQDHVTHSPIGRYDLRASGDDDCNSHQVVAAAAGVVMRVVESNDTSCSNGCSPFNNYVWIKHANDEWSKYTHFKKNSVAVAVGDTVCAGEFLGFECGIGATTPAYFRHLHFEIRKPNDPANPVIDANGFMASSDAAHLIPVICTITGKHYFEKDDSNPAGACSSTCNTANYLLGAVVVSNGEIYIRMASQTVNTISGSEFTLQNGGNGLFHASGSVTLRPGFTASAGCYFEARIGNCGTTPFPGGCN